MKTFKIKDLVVSVGEAAHLAPQTICHAPSFHCGGCSFHFSPVGCHAHSLTNCHGCTLLHTPICPGFTAHCLPHTFPHCIGTPINCGGTPLGCGGTFMLETKDTIRQFEHLKIDEIEVLKGELTKLQKAMEIRFQPQSMDDLNELETKLNEALKEVKVQKGNMK